MDIDKNELDNYITGHYGEDQFKDEDGENDWPEPEVCEHGVSEAEEPPCQECRDEELRERAAQLEAEWQQKVMGPLFEE